MKYISLLVTLAYTLLGFSQNWCSQGAEWTYGYNVGSDQAGYIKITFEKDTFINSISCKKITPIRTIRNYTFGIPSNIYIDTMESWFTYAQNDTVYFFYNQAFHSVYFFNAQKGDTLQIVNPTCSINCNDSLVRLAVDSSGTIQINNELLRFYIASPINPYPGQNIEPANVAVIEKLGVYYMKNDFGGYPFTILPFFSCNSAVELNCSLRCYKDDSLNLYQTNPLVDCDYLPTGIHNVSSPNLRVQVFPNPTSSFINIKPKLSEIEKITFYNIYGQIEKSEEYKNPEHEIQVDVHKFICGTYLLNIQLVNGASVTQTIFIKEQ